MDKKREIEKIAYQLYERSGFVCGNDMDHWLEAERIVCAKCEPAAKPKKATVKKGSETTAKTAKTAATVVNKPETDKGRSEGRTKKTSTEKRASL
jgi:hypothetical protein